MPVITTNDAFKNRPTVWFGGEEFYICGHEQDRTFRAVKKGDVLPAPVYLVIVPQLKVIEAIEQKRRATDK